MYFVIIISFGNGIFLEAWRRCPTHARVEKENNNIHDHILSQSSGKCNDFRPLT